LWVGDVAHSEAQDGSTAKTATLVAGLAPALLGAAYLTVRWLQSDRPPAHLEAVARQLVIKCATCLAEDQAEVEASEDGLQASALQNCLEAMIMVRSEAEEPEPEEEVVQEELVETRARCEAQLEACKRRCGERLAPLVQTMWQGLSTSNGHLPARECRQLLLLLVDAIPAREYADMIVKELNHEAVTRVKGMLRLQGAEVTEQMEAAIWDMASGNSSPEVQRFFIAKWSEQMHKSLVDDDLKEGGLVQACFTVLDAPAYDEVVTEADFLANLPTLIESFVGVAVVSQQAEVVQQAWMQQTPPDRADHILMRHFSDTDLACMQARQEKAMGAQAGNEMAKVRQMLNPEATTSCCD